MSRTFFPRATAARQGVLATFLSAGLLTLGASSANAGLVLTIDDLSNGVGVDKVVTDGDNDGVVNYNSLSDGGIGTWSLSVVTGVSKPVIGILNEEAKIDLNSVMVSGGTGTLVLRLTDTDFELSGTDWSSTNLTHHIGGTTSGHVTSQAWLDTNNAEFGMEYTTDPNPCTDATGPGSFSATCIRGISNLVPTTFSLTQEVSFTHTYAGQVTSFDSEVSFRVPEPASLAVIGSGLFGLGLLRRRRKA